MSIELLRTINTMDQIEEVCKLADEIWTEHYTPIIGKAQVEYMLDKFQSPSAVVQQLKEGYRYYFIMSEGHTAGYAAIKPEETRLFLSKIYVCRAYRQQGLAGRAVQSIAELARKLNLDRIYLTVNKHNDQSIAAYERMGFAKVKEAIAEIGNGYVMDDYIMEMTV